MNVPNMVPNTVLGTSSQLNVYLFVCLGHVQFWRKYAAHAYVMPYHVPDLGKGDTSFSVLSFLLTKVKDHSQLPILLENT